MSALELFVKCSLFLLFFSTSFTLIEAVFSQDVTYWYECSSKIELNNIYFAADEEFAESEIEGAENSGEYGFFKNPDVMRL